MLFRLDQLGKNLLREVFILVGTAEAEVEVPPGDAQRVDLWHVPEPELLRAHPEIAPGLLRAMASEPGMVEVFSDAPDTPAFNECTRKQHQWHHTLELRTKAPLPLPRLWLVCAGRPDRVLRGFGFARPKVGPRGHYATRAPGWRVYVVVVAELPRLRDTILLRLLGSGRVRRTAIRDLTALPEDAWERRLALPWLARLGFEVPDEAVQGLSDEEKKWIMETREWYEQSLKQAEERGEKRGEARGEKRGLVKAIIRLCGVRLGRPLAEAERAALTDRFDQLGEDRVEQVVGSFAPDALAAWLADPNAR